ncbi:hypothetical protein M758_4G002100 [Ceratodon purpureus]|nr:hypothetical protein M758_4G002100 [Ceratodon purpureus]
MVCSRHVMSRRWACDYFDMTVLFYHVQWVPLDPTTRKTTRGESGSLSCWDSSAKAVHESHSSNKFCMFW